MPRFTLKDLLTAVALIAVGLAMLMVLMRPAQPSAWAMAMPFAWPLIGAGVLWPFSRRWEVSVFGCLMMLVLAAVTFSEFGTAY